MEGLIFPNYILKMDTEQQQQLKVVEFFSGIGGMVNNIFLKYMYVALRPEKGAPQLQDDRRLRHQRHSKRRI